MMPQLPESTRAERWSDVAPKFHRLRKNRLILDGVIVLVATMSVNALNLVFTLSMTRQLGISSFGTLYLMMTIFAAGAVFLSIITTVVARLTAESRRKQDEAGLSLLAGSTLTKSALAALGACALILAAGPVMDGFFHLEGLAIVVSLATFVAVQIVLLGMRGILQGLEAFGPLAVSLVTEAVLRTGLAVLWVWMGYGVEGALYAYVLGAGFSLAYTILQISKKTGLRFGGTQLEFGKVLSLAGRVTGATLSLAALSSVDVVLVKHYFVGADPGLYGVVAASGRMLLLAASFVPMIVLPKAAAVAGRESSAKQLLLPAGLAVVGISAAGIAIFGLFPEEIVRLMGGANYLAATQFVLGYGIAMAILGLSGVIVAYRIGLNDFRFVPPIVSLVVAEALAIVWFHSSLAQIVHVVIGANVLALCIVLVGVTGSASRAKEKISKGDRILRLEEVMETM